MAFTTGTTAATNCVNDLLSKFRTWLTVTIGSPWTELAWTSGATDTDQATLSVRGPGAGTDRQVFINMQSRNGSGHYGVALTGATAYSGALAWGQQESESTEVFMNLTNAQVGGLDYWFYANDRRFIIMVEVSTSYPGCYCGFFLPIGTPEEYPFPLYVGANFDELNAYNLNYTRNRMFADPGYGAAHYRQRVSESWRRVSNHGESGSTTTSETDPERALGDAVMWPHGIPTQNSADSDDWQTAGKGFARWRQNEDGEAPIFQCHIIDPSAGVKAGGLDGVFGAVGEGRSALSTSVNGGTTYRYFPNIGRTGTRNIMAIEEV